MHIPEETSSAVQDSLLAICLFAAFADGEKSEVEREEVRRAAVDFGSENLGILSRKILMRKLSLQEVAAGLESSQDKLLAYEMALAVCESDGEVNASEREFLDELKGLLALKTEDAGAVEKEVDEVALAPVSVVPPPLPVAAAGPENGGMILKYAILNGALELLPETLATMAIIPMQMKMVYRIGKTHGFELDQSHIKEFLGTIGVGMGSQVMEGFARKLMQGFGKKLGGKMGGKVANQLTGSAFSFASTYALGKVAESYYASGRKLDVASIRGMFGPMRDQAEQLHGKYLPDIQAKAGELTPSKIFSLVRGGEV
ncbi:DUF533 domain-containing protein [Phragmitibacter flavus]|uniref:DUF533 domain-containing protein n=1 Tax=Phragmitibacter flavus TaxID=2576071 RepID=A0A5R8K8K3_9BACT|nr:DUF533 domain-containing protein [Phragmitibacter flavus]TLD68636.1 DUF533 domain-containing protein [Phragmitibacter flavus]